MAGIKDFIEFQEDFLGAQLFPTSATAGTLWKLTVTGAAPPTAAVASPTSGGEAAFALTAAEQIQILTLDFNDKLNFDVDDILSAEFRVKCSADFAASVSLGFGLQSARNNDLAATTAHAQFRLVANNSVVVETDDNVIDINTIATGQSLSTAYKRFYIDFAGGKSDVKFYIDGVRVAAGQRFDMSNYTGSFQPFLQLQKSSATSVATASWDYCEVISRRVR